MRSLAALSAVGCVVVLVGPRRRHIVAFEPLNPRKFAETALAGITVWAVASTIAPFPVAAACAILAALVPTTVGRARATRRRRAALARWPDFLGAVRTRLASGAPLHEACSAAARLLGHPFSDLETGPGIAFEATLRDAREAWNDPIADRVLTTLSLAAQTGGTRVGTVLGSLSESIADELSLRRSHDAALTEQRLTANVALVAPWVLLALSITTNPAADEAFASATGVRIILGGVVATVLGYWLARRSAQLSRPQRIFR